MKMRALVVGLCSPDVTSRPPTAAPTIEGVTILGAADPTGLLLKIAP